VKIPNKIKVAGHEYKIIWDNEYLSNQDYEGLTKHRSLKMYLCDKFRGQMLDKSIIEENFIHEMLHAIDVNYNNRQLTEEQISCMAAGVYQVLKDNFKF